MTGLLYALPLLIFAGSFQADCRFVGRGDELSDPPGLGDDALIYEADARLVLDLDAARVNALAPDTVYRTLMAEIEALVRDYPHFRTISPLVRTAYGRRADTPTSTLAFVREVALTCGQSAATDLAVPCPQNNFLIPQRRLREILVDLVDNHAVRHGLMKGCRSDALAWLRAVARRAGATQLATDAELVRAFTELDAARLREAVRAEVPTGCAPEHGYDFVYLSYVVGPGTEPSWYLIAYDFSRNGPTGEVPPDFRRVVPFEAIAGPSQFLGGAYTATFVPARSGEPPRLELRGSYKVDLALWPESLATQYHQQFVTDFVRAATEHISLATGQP